MNRLAFALLLGALPGLATAQVTTAPENERFTLQPTEGGYLRLNKETGAMSFCTVTNGVVACRLGAEERTAFESEIDRLRKENAQLKTRADLSPEKPGARPHAPSDEEFERALTFTERFMRSIMRIIREATPQGAPL